MENASGQTSPQEVKQQQKSRAVSPPPPPFSYLTVWGVEPVVTHQTCWLESTGVCGVRQNQAGGTSVQKRV